MQTPYYCQVIPLMLCSGDSHYFPPSHVLHPPAKQTFLLPPRVREPHSRMRGCDTVYMCVTRRFYRGYCHRGFQTTARSPATRTLAHFLKTSPGSH